jgi:hypothetical protein
VTLVWRRLGERELDHERIWGWIIPSTGLLGMIWLRLAGLPQIVCAFRTLTGLPCPTCGATRAVVALSRGAIGESFALNPLVPIAAAAASVYVPYALTVSHLGLPRLRAQLKKHDWVALRVSIVAAVAALWGYLIAAGR